MCEFSGVTEVGTGGGGRGVPPSLAVESKGQNVYFENRSYFLRSKIFIQLIK